MTQLLHLLHRLLALLEPPEVVLNEERGVEFADGDLVAARGGYYLVEQLTPSTFPDLFDHIAQLFIDLINITCVM